MIIVFITLFMFGQNDSTRTSVYDEFSHVPWEADSEMEFYVQEICWRTLRINTSRVINEAACGRGREEVRLQGCHSKGLG